MIVNVLIVGYNDDYYDELSRRIEEELVRKREIYLFNVLTASKESVGAKWALAHGVPIRPVKVEDNPRAQVEIMVKEADYVFAAYGVKGQSEAETAFVHRVVYKMMEQGKSGNVFALKEFK